MSKKDNLEKVKEFSFTEDEKPTSPKPSAKKTSK